MNNIPKLRYKGFDYKWKNYTLKEISVITTGKTPATSNLELWGKDLAFVTPTDINSKYQTTTERRVTNQSGIKSIICDPGDIAYTCIASIGKMAILTEKSITNQQINTLKVVGHNSEFVYYNLLKNKCRIRCMSGDFGMAMINKSDFGNIKTMFPETKEQQKIANMLSKIDQLLLVKKKEIEFNNIVRKKIINELATTQIGHSNNYKLFTIRDITKGIYDGPHVTPRYKSCGVPFISVENLDTDYTEIVKFVDKMDYLIERKRTNPSIDDILISRIGTIGRTRLIDFKGPITYYVTLALLKKSDLFDSVYLDNIISSDMFKKELHKRTLHVAFPIKINLSEIGECFVSLPPIEEQEKLGKTLNKLTNLIHLNNEELDNLKNLKVFVSSNMLL